MTFRYVRCVVLVVSVVAWAIGCGSSKNDAGGGDSSVADTAADAGVDPGVAPDSVDDDVAVPPDSAPDSAADAPAEVAADTAPDTAPDTAGPHDFVVPGPGVRFTYLLQRCGGDAFEVPGNYDTTIDLNGQTYRRVQVGDFEAATREGFETWSRFKDGTFQVAGAAVYDVGSPDPAMSYTLDPPITAPLYADEGATGTIPSGGQLCFGRACQPYEVSFAWTLVSKNASVTVPYGTVDGCIHLQIEQSEGGGSWGIEWWLKEGIGLVKATEMPGFCGLELKAFTLGD